MEKHRKVQAGYSLDCKRKSHHSDALLDWSDMAYDFGTHRENVAMDHHLM